MRLRVDVSLVNQANIKQSCGNEDRDVCLKYGVMAAQLTLFLDVEL